MDGGLHERRVRNRSRNLPCVVAAPRILDRDADHLRCAFTAADDVHGKLSRYGQQPFEQRRIAAVVDDDPAGAGSHGEECVVGGAFAVHRDGVERVARRFLEVMHLTSAPRALFHPYIVCRALGVPLHPREAS